MITRFRVNNFKNLLNVEFRPVGVNLLIGPNNAGKTNLCHALRFLSLSCNSPLDDAAGLVLGENWNISNVYVTDKNVDFETEVTLSDQGTELRFCYQLCLSVERELPAGKQTLKVVKEVLKVGGGGSGERILIENLGGQARVLLEGTAARADGQGAFLQTQVPCDATALSKLFDPAANRLALRFKQNVGSCFYFNLVPRALRAPKVVGKFPWMTPDGENFSKFLFTIHNEQPRLERRIIEALKLVEPKVDLFNFYSPDPEFILFLFEDKSGNRFSAQSISDGTLRYLALCCLIALMDDVNQQGGSFPLVIFEEPENGLYVGHLKPLIEKLDFQRKSGQCLFTSHSPYFIDLFDNHLEGVHLMRPGIPSSMLTQPDAAKVRRLLDDMPLGEMHYRELLG